MQRTERFEALRDNQQTDSVSDLLARVDNWLSRQSQKKSGHDTNTMTVGLILAQVLEDRLPVREEDIVSDGGSQVRGLSGSTIRRLLADAGEMRPFTSEGGRTSRGSLVKARDLRDVINRWHGDRKPDEKMRRKAARAMSDRFVRLLQTDYFGAVRLSAELDPSAPISTTVSRLIRASREAQGYVAGAMAQHLVGAKLELRFSDEAIGQESFAASDQSTDRHGDFDIGPNAYHVTISPSEALFSRRVKDNLLNHKRPVVLVPEDRLDAAQQLAANVGVLNRTGVFSIEAFVGLNIDEMTLERGGDFATGLRELIEQYNARVQRIEPDPALIIEVPANWSP